MKVLLLNGSPRLHGNTSVALERMEDVFAEEGIESEEVRVGTKDVRGCIACHRCTELGKCIFDDIVNEIAPKFEESAGLVVASPVYYASANATLEALLQRLFYSIHFDPSMKVGAAVAVARRAGTVSTFDQLNKFFSIGSMPIATSTYWNDLFGSAPGEVQQDTEGIGVVCNLAHNMAFLMKSIELGTKEFGAPKHECYDRRNFIA